MLNQVDRCRILVADDDPILLELFRSTINSDIYDVITVEDGAEAAELLMLGRFNLVVVDMLLPSVGGQQLIALIRRTPELQDLPIVVLTALVDEATQQACLSAGANAFLNKPVDWSKFSALLDELTMQDRAAEIEGRT